MPLTDTVEVSLTGQQADALIAAASAAILQLQEHGHLEPAMLLFRAREVLVLGRYGAEFTDEDYPCHPADPFAAHHRYTEWEYSCPAGVRHCTRCGRKEYG